jgi:hypothetical protein
MMLPWSTIVGSLLLVSAFTLTTLNVIFIGGFIGRATTVHADLDSLNGRKTAKNLVGINALLAFLFLALLILYAGSLGWQTYSSYARSKGCDLSKDVNSYSDV